MESIIKQLETLISKQPSKEGTYLKHKVTGEVIERIEDLDLSKASDYTKETVTKEDNIAALLSSIIGEPVEVKENKVGKKGIRRTITVDKSYFETVFKLALILKDATQPGARDKVYSELGFRIAPIKPIKESSNSEFEAFKILNKKFVKLSDEDKEEYKKLFPDFFNSI